MFRPAHGLAGNLVLGGSWCRGNCHQRSLVGVEPVLRLLRLIPGAEVIDLDAGCCGMAGSFGYEAEHYEVSRLVGEQRLLPAVRQAEPEVIVVAQDSHAGSRSNISPVVKRFIPPYCCARPWEGTANWRRDEASLPGDILCALDLTVSRCSDECSGWLEEGPQRESLESAGKYRTNHEERPA